MRVLFFILIMCFKLTVSGNGDTTIIICGDTLKGQFSDGLFTNITAKFRCAITEIGFKNGAIISAKNSYGYSWKLNKISNSISCNGLLIGEFELPDTSQNTSDRLMYFFDGSLENFQGYKSIKIYLKNGIEKKIYYTFLKRPWSDLSTIPDSIVFSKKNIIIKRIDYSSLAEKSHHRKIWVNCDSMKIGNQSDAINYYASKEFHSEEFISSHWTIDNLFLKDTIIGKATCIQKHDNVLSALFNGKEYEFESFLKEQDEYSTALLRNSYDMSFKMKIKKNGLYKIKFKNHKIRRATYELIWDGDYCFRLIKQ